MDADQSAESIWTPRKLRHGPHCGPAQLSGWANCSIWEKVKARSQEAVFGSNGCSSLSRATNAGVASRVPPAADRRTTLLALNIAELVGRRVVLRVVVYTSLSVYLRPRGRTLPVSRSPVRYVSMQLASG